MTMAQQELRILLKLRKAWIFSVFVNFIQEFNPGHAAIFLGSKRINLTNVVFLGQRSKPSLSNRSLYFFSSTFLVLYHWAGPSNYDDSDDDVAEKAPK